MSRWQMVTELPRLAPRERSGHKGTYGRILIVAGSRGMAGAAGLAGMAALRGGAGLVYVACPESVVEIVSGFEPSYLTIPLPCDADGRSTVAAADMLLERPFDVLAIGPGLGQSDSLYELVTRLIKSVDKPMVIDADGLNLLSRDVSLLDSRKGPTVLTPHPGEFSRLTGEKIGAEDRTLAASRFALEHRVILVLKGAGTVVSDGNRTYVNNTGNPGMGTGGTGDVLTGLTAALLGQGFAGFEAAQLGVHLHGIAGDIVAEEKGEISLIARDVVDALPQAFRRFG